MKESMREDIDWENYLSEYNSRRTESPHENRDIPSYENFSAKETTLASHLTWQICMSDFTDTYKEIGSILSVTWMKTGSK
jgi:RNA polymerase sigma-54 factor